MRRLVPLVAIVLVAAACGGASSGPPKALLDPSKLDEKAPQLYDVKFETTAGDFVVSVHRTWAPIAADRFYNLVKNKFYDGNKIFRVVPGFVVQFGISPFPQVSKAWQDARIDDDTITVKNTRGAVTFASAGPNTRTTQVFVNLGNNENLDVDTFAPFAAVTEGMSVLDKLYSGYGDQPTPQQQKMFEQGNAFLERQYPKLDEIKTARIIDESSPALP